MALILSFFIMGAGQLYNGEVGKGLGMFFGAFFLGFMGILPFVGMIFWFPLLGLYIWNLVDAITSAERINREIQQRSGYPYR